MITVIRDMIARRRLLPVVRDLPHLLKKRYGGSDYYTASQVQRGVDMLTLGTYQASYAYAVACTETDFLAAKPHLSEHDYRTLRADVGRLFELDGATINCRKLTSAFASTGGSASDADAIAGIGTFQGD